MFLLIGGLCMKDKEKDESNKNIKNPDFLWDLDSLGTELRSAFLDASQDLYEDIERLRMQEEMFENLDEEDE